MNSSFIVPSCAVSRVVSSAIIPFFVGSLLVSLQLQPPRGRNAKLIDQDINVSRLTVSEKLWTTRKHYRQWSCRAVLAESSDAQRYGEEYAKQLERLCDQNGWCPKEDGSLTNTAPCLEPPHCRRLEARQRTDDGDCWHARRVIPGAALSPSLSPRLGCRDNTFWRGLICVPQGTSTQWLYLSVSPSTRLGILSPQQ